MSERFRESLVRDVRVAGARAHVVGETAETPVFRLPALPELARPLLELLPVEMLTLALAAVCGREAGRFDRISMVTAAAETDRRTRL